MPPKEEIKDFLDILSRLLNFEASQRHIRGYGVFSKEESENFPNPSVVNTVSWLVDLTK